MRNGIVGLELAPGAQVDAPASGVRLGGGQTGPLSLRLFRSAGTRVALAARVLPVQLLVVRTTAAGTPVQVVTSRPPLWEPLLRGAAHGRVVPDPGGLQATGGPSLLVDDRPAVGRTAVEIRPWQCRIDVRTQWTPAELPGFGRYDIAVFGAVPPEIAVLVSRAFALPRGAADPLSRLDAGSFAVLRHGHVDYVSLDPTAAEGQLLDQARGAGAASARLLR
ncbi:hypothetical protein SAMN05443575_2573 [Jatrophihabitans endophyticus]|uniref:Uncharacterized protein n=1 Tax=Jatrophihabitans endophyticus TaxID=1206085 RepID=A0A1M5LXK4_9ACTN|nr:hypothetical protein [Jatrophihabitans endophyticus]SHG69736.1 hypothetical protein SAMN05443575_2573 [Jatrophihabitans endophyticus]